MPIYDVALTEEEQKLIKKKRSQSCREGQHLKGQRRLPNGRVCFYCTNCLWALPAEIGSGPDDLHVGSVDIKRQLRDRV